MVGVSGCFGTPASTAGDSIDNVSEVNLVVDDIMDTTVAVAGSVQETTALVQRNAQLEGRVRILSVAVALLAVALLWRKL